MKLSSSSPSISIAAIILFLLLPLAIYGCPFQVQQFCACVDQLDGVLLNCTAPEVERTTAVVPLVASSTQQPTTANGRAAQMMQVLKSSQAHLGLLKLLSIHNTPIPVLSDNFFGGLYIRRLELVNCQIERVERGAFRGLEGVLQELIVTSNGIQEMPSEALQQMNSLFRLDFSNNSIGELKAEHALPRIPKLNDINLSHNRISGVHKTFFENVKVSLQTINLGHNHIEEVPASALRGFRLLMALHLHNNRLPALPQLSFMNLPLLSLLNLASNRIQQIHRQAFLNAPQLRFLYLSGNGLTEVLPFQFSSFERLEMLDLSNNMIEAIPNDSFAGLPAMRQLYLGDNKIHQIQPHAFSANSSIAVLILEQNQMTELGKEGFQNLRQVQQISLKGNKLRSIDAAAFQGNPSLVMLDLSHNELLDLAPATFLSQLNLLLVDLSHNRIIRTPFGAFGRRVATVLLQENPLVCSERIHMLQQGNGVLIPNSEDAICGGSNNNMESTTANQDQRANQREHFPGAASSPSGEFVSHPARGSSADFDIDDGEEADSPVELPSAFVQQIDKQNYQTVTSHAANQEHSQSIGQGSVANRLNNIKPIRITPSPIQNEKRERGETAHWSSGESTEPIALSESMATSDSAENIIKITTATLEDLQEATTDSTTVDDAESRFNPNIIYPHPVPFLKPAPKMHMATHIENDENGNPILTATLPPSILVADNFPSDLSRPLPEGDADAQTNAVDQPPTRNAAQWKNHSSSDYGKFEEFALSPSNNAVKDSQRIDDAMLPDVVEGGESVEKVTSGKSMLPTAVIVVCMGTVGVVMCAVFVGLCVARKRQLRQMSEVGIHLTTTNLGGCHHSEQHSPNSNSYMTAAAAARAAQMSAFYPKHYQEQLGTMQRGMHRSASGTMNRLPPVQDDIYGWLYTPNGYNAFKK